MVRSFLNFAADSPEREVPDPYYGAPDGFERVMNLVEEALEGLPRSLRKRRRESGV